ncbi:hypothetical protein RJT34_03082 [Clitoria ternatea]|uniref:HD-ZIP protein N-terminal domain-containing protein n=1 Tax=Clitoria ternatea TaxID=43366 RepID=A0AAN9KLG8_CLITE
MITEKHDLALSLSLSFPHHNLNLIPSSSSSPSPSPHKHPFTPSEEFAQLLIWHLTRSKEVSEQLLNSIQVVPTHGS